MATASACLAQRPSPTDPQESAPQISAALVGGYDAAVVFRMVASSVAVVRTDAGRQGSAVAVAALDDAGTLFATNCHVLRDAKKVHLSIQKGTYEGRFMGGNPEVDACVVFIEGLKAKVPEMMNPYNVVVGEKVYAIGTPQGLTHSISEGIISGKRGGLLQPPLLLQTTAAISSGSSGGGLFDSRARLIGITTFQLKDGQNLNFAISINDVVFAIEKTSKVESLDELSEYMKRMDGAVRGK